MTRKKITKNFTLLILISLQEDPVGSFSLINLASFLKKDQIGTVTVISSMWNSVWVKIQNFSFVRKNIRISLLSAYFYPIRSLWSRNRNNSLGYIKSRSCRVTHSYGSIFRYFARMKNF